MKLRQYQIDLSEKGSDIINHFGMVMLNMQVRTGKTLTALNICKLQNANKVLFITKKKAISSIEGDYKKINCDFELKVINYESVSKVNEKYDIVICDEYHSMGAFPKPSKRVKDVKKIAYQSKIIYLSGTPSPESYSQLFHPLFISCYSPFIRYSNFYRWADDFVDVYKINYGYAIVNKYEKANFEKIKPFIEKICIDYTQSQAGFESVIKEHVVTVEMSDMTYKIANELKKNLFVKGKEEIILADTGVKLMGKLHQLYSGTVKFESGNSIIIDKTKADFIYNKFKGDKIAIFYKFKEELNALKSVFGDELTTELNDFETSSKNIALQIISGREGINLSKAKYLVYYNLDFSATSYWQSRDRLTTIDRKSNEIYFIFAKNGIEQEIYKRVMKKKDFTLTHFKKYVSVSN